MMQTLYVAIIAAMLSACAAQTGSVTSHALAEVPLCSPEFRTECEAKGWEFVITGTTHKACVCSNTKWCPDQKFNASCRERGGTTKRTGRNCLCTIDGLGSASITLPEGM